MICFKTLRVRDDVSHWDNFNCISTTAMYFGYIYVLPDKEHKFGFLLGKKITYRNMCFPALNKS